MPFPAKHISISINRNSSDVYAYTSDPRNVPEWAAGLASGLTQQEDHWIADSPMGKVKVTFTENNQFGILDHTVELPTGQKVYNPLRVLSNNEDSEVIFTLFRLPGVTDEEYAADAEAIRKDLEHLKMNLEK